MLLFGTQKDRFLPTFKKHKLKLIIYRNKISTFIQMTFQKIAHRKSANKTKSHPKQDQRTQKKNATHDINAEHSINKT